MKRQNKGGSVLFLLLGAASLIAGCSVEAGRPDVSGPGLEPAGAKSPGAPAATPADPAKPPEHCKNVPAYPNVTGSINGATIVGSTSGAADAFQASCGAEKAGDAAFVVQPKKNGPITATTDHPGTDYDTVISVRALCSDPLTEIACNDDWKGLRSTVTWDATAGAAYLVVVSGFWTHEGNFELGLTQVAGKMGAQPASPATPSEPATPGGPGGPAIPPVFCQHSECAPGAPLKDGCSSCVNTVCGVDKYCCDVGWDAQCVMEAGYMCGTTCPPPPPGSCGDGKCSATPGDDCTTCPGDCGPCLPPPPPPGTCGDGFCSFTPGDDCFMCPGDCGPCPPPPPSSCGDGFCSWMPGDDCMTCPGDCGSCPPLPTCGDGVCSQGPGDDCWMCPADCGQCPPPPLCGDGVCDSAGGEGCVTCAPDCGACPPPPVCGDGVCQETCFACPLDCECPPAACGDGQCTPGESCLSCAGDCGACQACSHDECTTGAALGYECSPCVTSVCAVDAYCCSVAWDAICVSEMQSICGTTCAP